MLKIAEQMAARDDLTRSDRDGGQLPNQVQTFTHPEDVTINDRLIKAHAAAWSPGGGYKGHHRRLMTLPNGWWNPLRSVVSADDGIIRIKLHADQSYYDEQIAIQTVEEDAWAKSFIPVKPSATAVTLAFGPPRSRSILVTSRRCVSPRYRPLMLSADNGIR